ncbi:unnamed protein product [Brachionus calyciflorus]|uniref:Chromo domain-containing protein n=1 Tax=Brachionus calyciflorus TaxID=104777 RepID=A0A813NQ03_9BILA|nr:unnamed protein product [Brachionus calyciflorus]
MANDKDKVKLMYQEGETVLCYHGPLLYEAKCTKTEIRNKVPHYLIHYSGWNKSWDEWVTCPRVLKYNEENLKKQQELLATHGTSKIASKIKSGSRKHVNSMLERNADLERASQEDKDNKKKKQKTEDTNELVESYQVKNEVQIRITDELKQLLIEDYKNIAHNNKLLLLPSSNTIQNILEEYSKYKLEKKFDKNIITEIVEGIKDYFNAAISCRLLYSNEKSQYNEIMKDSNKKPSEIYGSIHLLRLLAKIGELLSYTYWEELCIKQLVLHIEDIIWYLNENKSSLFSPKAYISQNQK